MAIRLYLDEDSMSHSPVAALRGESMDVLTALEAGVTDVPDEDQLAFAVEQGHCICSFNVRDFHRLHGEFLGSGRPHAGIILSRQNQYSIGEQSRRIMNLSNALAPADMINRLEFLSDWA